MRLHTLTLENLNALYGAQTIDFDRVAGEGGLFLVRGVTGAGKSTILDAISLALYGRTVRFDLGKKGQVALEGEGARPNEDDPAHVMSRGTGRSRAELVFSLEEETGRRTRYRASWRVRRARERDEGALQEPERNLEVAEGETWRTLVSKGGKRAAEEAFAKVLRGLSFEDFQRTVLLAQFRFQEFLSASEDERARILERMTSSERFRAIGVAASKELDKARRAVEAIEAELGVLRPLGPEERAAKEQDLACLREELEGAREALRRSSDTLAARAALDVELARREGLEVSRRLAIAEAERTLEAAHARLAEVEDARRTLEAAEREQQRVEPLVREAEALWAAAQHLDAQAIEARALAQAKRQEEERARVARGAAEEELATIAGRMAARDEERRAIPGAAILEERRETIVVALERARDAAAARAADLEAMQGQTRKLAEHLATETGVIAATEQAREERDAAARALADAERALVATTGGLRAAEAANAIDEALAEAAERERSLMERARRIEARDDAQRLLDEAVRGCEEADRAAKDAALRRDEMNLRVGQAERARGVRFELVTALVELLGVLAHRGVLREGEACPLCGSVEHPYRAHPERAPRYEEREAQLVDARGALALADAALEAARGELLRVDRALTAAERDLEHARGAVAEGASRLAEAQRALDSDAPEMSSDLGVVNAAAESCRAQVAELRVRRTAIQDAAAAEQAARAKAEEAAMSALREEGRLAVHEAGSAARRAELSRLEAELARKDAAMGVAEERLSSALVGLELPREGPLPAAEQALALLDRLAAIRASRASLEGEYRDAELKVTEARVRDEESARAGREAESEETRTRVAAEDARARAADALGGEAPRSVREALAQAVTDATRALEGRREAWSVGEREAVAARERAHAATRACEDHLAATSALVEAVARACHDEELFSRAHAPERVVPNEPFDRSREAAEARVRERERRVEAIVALESALRTGLEADDVLLDRLRERRDALGVAQGELLQWKAIDDLIGTRDGQRFVRVVQALNLERVLSRANENLRRFMPRYELRQVVHAQEGLRLEFRVIDREQGDAARPTRSLSGGESFVVALALALGLASTRSGKMRIETLLIDEGFGSLDAKTLHLATSALTALQASLGVRVGIISHVDALREAIPAQILVEPVGAGRSIVRCLEGRGADESTG